MEFHEKIEWNFGIPAKFGHVKPEHTKIKWVGNYGGKTIETRTNTFGYFRLMSIDVDRLTPFVKCPLIRLWMAFFHGMHRVKLMHQMHPQREHTGRKKSCTHTLCSVPSRRMWMQYWNERKTHSLISLTHNVMSTKKGRSSLPVLSSHQQRLCSVGLATWAKWRDCDTRCLWFFCLRHRRHIFTTYIELVGITLNVTQFATMYMLFIWMPLCSLVCECVFFIKFAIKFSKWWLLVHHPKPC